MAITRGWVSRPDSVLAQRAPTSCTFPTRRGSGWLPKAIGSFLKSTDRRVYRPTTTCHTESEQPECEQCQGARLWHGCRCHRSTDQHVTVRRKSVINVVVADQHPGWARHHPETA